MALEPGQRQNREVTMYRRSLWVLVFLFGAGVVGTACSSSGSASSTTASGPSHHATVSTAPATVPATDVVTTDRISVAGRSEVVLADRRGYTLYYFLPDTSAKAACTSALGPTGKPCISIWHPLLLPSGTPGTTASLPGTLTAVSDGNGRQVEYQGHPLYRYTGDTGPGQAHGEGILGKWFVATPSLTAAGYAGGSGSAGSSTPSSTTTPYSSGNGAY